MADSADLESSHSDANMIELLSNIELLSAQEAVRCRPMMYISSTDQRGLHELLQLTIGGMLWHYRHFEHALERIEVRLEEDGGSIVTSFGGKMVGDVLEQSTQFLERELFYILVGPCSFFVVSALSRSLRVTVREPKNRWRSLLFERGILQRDEERVGALDENCDMQFCIQPDFTILETGTFDYQHTLELIRSLQERNPDVLMTVLDRRVHNI